MYNQASIKFENSEVIDLWKSYYIRREGKARHFGNHKAKSPGLPLMETPVQYLRVTSTVRF